MCPPLEPGEVDDAPAIAPRRGLSRRCRYMVGPRGKRLTDNVVDGAMRAVGCRRTRSHLLGVAEVTPGRVCRSLVSVVCVRLHRWVSLKSSLSRTT